MLDKDTEKKYAECYGGMNDHIKTLRDEFAMAALTGMCAADENYDVPAETLAIWAYEQADAMMQERQRTREGG